WTHKVGVSNKVASEWKHKVGVSNKVASEWKHTVGVSNKVASEWKHKVGVSNKVASEWKHKVGVSNKVASEWKQKVGVSNKVASEWKQKFRDLDVPTCVRLAELLTYLQEKGEEACREFYRALHLHVEDVYFSLPTRLRRHTDSVDPVPSPAVIPTDRFVLHNQGPLFFLSCFSAVAGAAFLYYYGDFKTVSGSSSALGLAALGIGRKIREVLIWYT
uniref:Caspase recruitment domain family, member 19 n=1 Tax=Pygocentrus nattereri TaxID=42514 RepID=A0A3B4ELS0_PYGNA